MTATQTAPHDGRPYDTKARRQLAVEARRAQRSRQPRGVPRPDGPLGLEFLVRQAAGRGSASDFFAALPAKYPRLAYLRMAGTHV